MEQFCNEKLANPTVLCERRIFNTTIANATFSETNQQLKLNFTRPLLFSRFLQVSTNSFVRETVLYWWTYLEIRSMMTSDLCDPFTSHWRDRWQSMEGYKRHSVLLQSGTQQLAILATPGRSCLFRTRAPRLVVDPDRTRGTPRWRFRENRQLYVVWNVWKQRQLL